MVHIVLLVLKIIGILLACIVGVVLLLLLAALFVPVRYRLRVARTEGEGAPPAVVYAKVSWLLHFVNILARYPAEVTVRARLGLIAVFRIPQKEKKAKKEKPGKKNKAKEAQEPEKQPEQTGEQEKEQEKQSAFETSTPQESGAGIGGQSSENSVYAGRQSDKNRADAVEQSRENNADAVEQSREDTTDTEEQGQESVAALQAASTETDSRETPADGPPPETEADEAAGGRPGIFDRIRRFVRQIRKFFQNIQYTIGKLCDKIKNTLQNIEYYRKLLESDTFRQSFALCREELAWIFRKLKPRRLEADLIVGMADPAATGQVLAVYGMLYPMIGRNVRVVGDFDSEKRRIEGELYLCGRVNGYTFVRAALRIYCSKEVRKLIKMFQKEAE